MVQPAGGVSADDLSMLASRVSHDHLRGAAGSSVVGEAYNQSDAADLTGRGKVRRREEKEIRKMKLAEAHYLMSECQVPIAKVAKRLRLSYSFLRRVNKLGMFDPKTAFTRRGHRPRF